MTMKESLNISKLKELAQQYNNMLYFENDPIIFPKRFADGLDRGEYLLKDVEIAAILASHLAWGRRAMIVRNCGKMFDEMKWQPYQYIIKEKYKSDNISLHRTIKWSEFALICENLRKFYLSADSLEHYTPAHIRTHIFGRKADKKAANKKIHMLRRWMVRNDGIVDLGVWKNISPSDLIIPLDVHVHRSAIKMGITKRKSADIVTALEITEYLKKIFPDDPCKGDFALFAYAASKNQKNG